MVFTADAFGYIIENRYNGQDIDTRNPTRNFDNIIVLINKKLANPEPE
ncbi:Putative protein [Zobellia galactanivorans]|uniref:Uncharacterized protein n=1 Tax=Zobellia galactanivorans (strain DSM 12802 / CCUG 47099 / CIP 106680 / NCIMB 13871 / Dsij) TaxID=63186 RepID=G0L909_ZOBGA|nr:Putative protein [Zobellia galactanivorans]